MFHCPNMDSVVRIMRALGYEFNGPWQVEAMEAMCNHASVIIQGPRQLFGKSFLGALYGSAVVTGGGNIIVGLPTRDQSSRIIARDIAGIERDGMVDRANRVFAKISPAIKFKKPVAQKTETVWRMPAVPEFTASVMALSTNEVSRHKPEGYHSDVLMIDEGHRSTRDMMGIFLPFIFVARRNGWARFFIFGVGGHPSSLIEENKKPPYKIVHWKASQIAAIDPRCIPIIEEAKRSMPPWQFLSHMECEPVGEGLQMLYDVINESVDMSDYIGRGIPSYDWFGIDVGRVHDETVVKVLRRCGDRVNEVATLRTGGKNFLDQADEIYQWIDANFVWSDERIACEINGMGWGLFDILQRKYFDRMIPITTDGEGRLKEDVYRDTSMAFRDGQFGISDPESLADYQNLRYEIGGREKNKMLIEHSDTWMAMAMAWTAMQAGQG